MTFKPQRTLFGFLVMVYDRAGDGDKLLYENFGLERSRFYSTSHLLELKIFFLPVRPF